MRSKLLRNVLIAALAVITFSSCKKKPLYPTDELPSHVPTASVDTSLCVGGWGEFVITDAVMYVDDRQTGQHLVYNHFTAGKDTSSLRWGGPLFDIEVIVKNATTYSFWKPNAGGYGKFVLNDDTTKYYAVQYTGQYKSIIEDPDHNQQNLGGSARPYSGQTVDVVNKIIHIQIEEADGVDNSGHAIHYWTQLTLKKIKEW